MGILRLLLALSVVVAHTSPVFGLYLVGGEIAVKTFFIISGFYMTFILNEKYIGKNKSYKLFIGNRFLRLYPVYWVVLLLTVIICGVVGVMYGDYPVIGQYASVNHSFVSTAYAVLANLFIFGQDIMFFAGVHASDGSLFFTSDFAHSDPQLFRVLFAPQAWTLALELMFYLIAPFLLTRGYKVVVPLILLSLGLRLFLHFGLELQKDPWTYRFFPSELMFFLLGFISYKVYSRYRDFEMPGWISISMFLWLVIFTMIYPMIPTYGYPLVLREILYYGSATVCIPFIFKYFKSSKWDAKIGELSYPVYISHVMIIMLISIFKITSLQTGMMICCLTVGLSILLNKYIADPVEKYRQSRIVKP